MKKKKLLLIVSFDLKIYLSILYLKLVCVQYSIVNTLIMHGFGLLRSNNQTYNMHNFYA